MKILAQFVIANLNIRREKAGEGDGPVACDIKLTSDLKSDAVASFFSTDSSRKRVLDSLWTDEGELTTTDVQKITLTAQIKGGRLSLTPEFSAAETFETADINKITIAPKAGKTCEVSIRAQVKPTPEQMGRLAELLHCEILVTADRKQGELELQAQPPEEEKPEEEQSDEKPGDGAVVPGQKPPQRPKRSAAPAVLQ